MEIRRRAGEATGGASAPRERWRRRWESPFQKRLSHCDRAPATEYSTAVAYDRRLSTAAGVLKGHYGPGVCVFVGGGSESRFGV